MKYKNIYNWKFGDDFNVFGLLLGLQVKQCLYAEQMIIRNEFMLTLGRKNSYN